MIGTGRRVGDVGDQRAERDHHLDAEPLGGVEDRSVKRAPAQVRLGSAQQDQVALGAGRRGGEERVRGPVDRGASGPSVSRIVGRLTWKSKNSSGSIRATTSASRSTAAASSAVSPRWRRRSSRANAATRTGERSSGGSPSQINASTREPTGPRVRPRPRA